MVKTLTPSSSNRLLALISVLCLSTSCSVEESNSPPSQKTPDYLLQAIDVDQFFRWTPKLGDAGIIIPIFVRDTQNALTPEDREKYEMWIQEARDKWKIALLDGGVPVDTITKFEWKGEVLGGSQIQIQFGESFPNSSLSGGVTHMASGGDPDKVLAMFMGLVLKNGITGESFTDEQRRYTVLHEFGHALGIYDPGSGEAHSSNQGDVMSSSSWAWWTLSDGDKAAIVTLYNMTPTMVRADG